MKILIGVTVGVVTLVLAALAIAALVGGSASAARKIGTQVQVEPATRGVLVESATASGEVAPRTKVAISARITARIAALPHKQGAAVTAGDPQADPPVPASVLVRLDAKDLEAALAAAEARRAAQVAQIQVEQARIAAQEAQIRQTRATLEQARRELRRHEQLLETSDVSRSLFDQARSRVLELEAGAEASEHSLAAARRAIEVLKHNLAAADAELNRARDDLDNTVITSPIDGVVTKLNTEVGEMAVTGTMNNPGTIILEVADLSHMVMNAQVDEADIGRVEVGQPVDVHIHAYPDRVFEGEVTSIALTATSVGSKYFETEIRIRTDRDRFYSGLSADAEIQVQRHDRVLKVPSQAVLGRQMDQIPLKVREAGDALDQAKTVATVVYRLVDGKAVVTPVRIGPSDPTHTVIEAGLDEGELVVTGPFKILETIEHDQAIRREDAESQTDEDEQREPETAPPDESSPGDTPAEDTSVESPPAANAHPAPPQPATRGAA